MHHQLLHELLLSVSLNQKPRPQSGVHLSHCHWLLAERVLVPSFAKLGHVLLSGAPCPLKHADCNSSTSLKPLLCLCRGPPSSQHHTPRC